MKRRIKTFLGMLLYRTGLYKRFWRDGAVIVLFHRVDDRYTGDPITSTCREFQRYCDFFGKYFSVVGLDELLERLSSGADIRRHVVITFDDGYRDNHDFAAVELEKRRMPACFYVATGFMGTSENVWWDTMRNVRSEWMTWDEVRSVGARGFEIGAHTVTHPDLGEIGGNAAVAEIVGSRDRLRSELKNEVRHFAYPFGGEDQMTEANRDIVRAAGFSSCVSAFGGCVLPGDDPFRLNRVPINNWYVSPYQFGFETLQSLVGKKRSTPRNARPVHDSYGSTSGLR